MIDRRFIRPVPPENPYDCVFLKEGSVVDADLRGGWWVGTVINKMEDDQNQNYLVYLDFPPDIIQFERRQLKAHLDWNGSKWVRPVKKELLSSVFSTGTMVELREDFSSWREVMIVKELENETRFIVKKCNNKSFSCTGDSENETVDSIRVRPMQPHFSVEKYELVDRVEAFSGFVWRQGMVSGVLCDGRYMVRFRETREDVVFNRSDLRPLMEWKDGVWHTRVKRESEEETPSDGERNNSVASETLNEMADDDDDDDDDDEIIATPEKQEKRQGKTHEPMRSQNGEEKSRKRKDKEEDTQIVLPFTKKSLVWKMYESMEVFKRVPQTPHFGPLIKKKEDFVKGLR